MPNFEQAKWLAKMGATAPLKQIVAAGQVPAAAKAAAKVAAKPTAVQTAANVSKNVAVGATAVIGAKLGGKESGKATGAALARGTASFIDKGRAAVASAVDTATGDATRDETLAKTTDLAEDTAANAGRVIGTLEGGEEGKATGDALAQGISSFINKGRGAVGGLVDNLVGDGSTEQTLAKVSDLAEDTATGAARVAGAAVGGKDTGDVLAKGTKAFVARARDTAGSIVDAATGSGHAEQALKKVSELSEDTAVGLTQALGTALGGDEGKATGEALAQGTRSLIHGARDTVGSAIDNLMGEGHVEETLKKVSDLSADTAAHAGRVIGSAVGGKETGEEFAKGTAAYINKARDTVGHIVEAVTGDGSGDKALKEAADLAEDTAAGVTRVLGSVAGKHGKETGEDLSHGTRQFIHRAGDTVGHIVEAVTGDGSGDKALKEVADLAEKTAAGASRVIGDALGGKEAGEALATGTRDLIHEATDTVGSIIDAATGGGHAELALKKVGDLAGNTAAGASRVIGAAVGGKETAEKFAKGTKDYIKKASDTVGDVIDAATGGGNADKALKKVGDLAEDTAAGVTRVVGSVAGKHGRETGEQLAKGTRQFIHRASDVVGDVVSNVTGEGNVEKTLKKASDLGKDTAVGVSRVIGTALGGAKQGAAVAKSAGEFIDKARGTVGKAIDQGGALLDKAEGAVAGKAKDVLSSLLGGSKKKKR